MLKNQQIIIRPVQATDIAVLSQCLGELESLGEFLPTLMQSEVLLRQAFETDGLLSETSQRYVITDHENVLLGSIWAFKSVPYFDAMEVGYHIFETRHRGQGIATQALRLITGYLFDSRPLNRVEVRMAVDNLASEAVAKNVGFNKEGTHREAAFSKGRLHDMHLYALLRREWTAL